MDSPDSPTSNKTAFSNFKGAFQNCLLNRTGIVLNNGPCHVQEMDRDLDRALRLSGLAGDETSGVDMGKDDQGDWSDESTELLSMVEKLGPLNPNLASEAFIKPFFKHLNFSQFNIQGVDEDLLKFTSLTFLDLSKNQLSLVDYLPPSLKFFKGYNNTIQRISCRKLPSLCFLGAGYNKLGTSGFEQISQRFRNLLSLDLSYNNLTEIRNFTSDAQTLQKLRHLTLVGNPLCLLPYYRLIIINHLPQMQILDDVQVGEAEASDAQLVDSTLLERPTEISLAVSFVQVKSFRGLVKQLAKELPATVMQDEEEVEVPLEDRITEVCKSGNICFSVELPDGRWIDTTSVPLSSEENPDEPVPEEIDLSGLLKQGEAKPEHLYFVLPVNSAPLDTGRSGSKHIDKGGAPDGPPDDLVVIRDWVRRGVKVKAFFQKNGPARSPVEEGENPKTPNPPEPRQPIGGCIVPLNSVLRPSVCTIPDEARQERSLPLPPPPINIGPVTVNLAPYSFWIEPDVQVPLCDVATKNIGGDDSAVFKMGITLYAKEPPPLEEAGEE